MPLETTLEDVAKRAGVHRSTVSLALRNSPRIRPEVRARIQQIAHEMHYRVNPSSPPSCGRGARATRSSTSASPT
ncbi:LacI family DNA-binding transcriptional regulator [Oleiharenicola sp. Vm1]|uniref:LacI family DNA-binding transcriptional regulator n=1 Tax=Oleiharenicola sp. Vm1 TaxID=3398393 RepID=UPI0039F5AB04